MFTDKEMAELKFEGEYCPQRMGGMGEEHQCCLRFDPLEAESERKWCLKMRDTRSRSSEDVV